MGVRVIIPPLPKLQLSLMLPHPPPEQDLLSRFLHDRGAIWASLITFLSQNYQSWAFAPFQLLLTSE